MKRLTKKQTLLVSFMLFSLFFGAGNLIFPPFLGQNAGSATPVAITTFLITAVALPVLGVVAVAQFDGLDKLSKRVGKTFAIIFTILIYLSIGPGLGIPRAASVPFEMAVAPYLPSGTNLTIFMLVFSFTFFAIACWLALTPNKLVERIGKFLTPSLLVLLSLLFISFLMKGNMQIAAPVAPYDSLAAIQGFLEGYNTMDTIAALNFGLVIATTIQNFGITDKKTVMRTTIKCGIFAGIILSIIYLMLAYLGMATSGVFEIQENGAWTLRCIVAQVFGNGGAILLAAIFTLACLTTCVGLITSISQYFSILFKRFTYRQFVYGITFFSFVVCNQGLNAILSISVPVLNAIYPISITLIILGLFDKFIIKLPYVYPITICAVAFTSIVHALFTLKLPLGFIGNAFKLLPFFEVGLGWVPVAIVCVAICSILSLILSTKYVQLKTNND